MLKSFSSLKKYYLLAGVKRYLLLLEFCSFLIPSILSIVSPVLAANVISSLTVFDFSKAILMLALDFGIIILTALLYFLYHIISNKTTKIIVKNLQESVYNNAKNNASLSKIHSSTLSNIWLCAEFNRKFLYKICFFIKSVIILGVIIYFNYIIGLILIFISVVSFLLLRLTNQKIQTYDAALTVYKQNSLDLFNNIKQGTAVEPNAVIENSLKDKYFDYVDSSIQIKNRISLYYNINNNFISLILKVAVFAITIYLISLIKATALTLALYLILTPYLTSSAENLISFFEIFPEIALMDNALQEFDSIKYQSPEPAKRKTFDSFGVTISSLQIDRSLEPLNLYVPFGSVCLIKASKKEICNTVFKVFSTKQRPLSGNIFVDNQSIFEFSETELGRVVSFTSSKPYFYNMSIFENLFLVCDNKTAIFKAIKFLGLKEMVESLDDGINTLPSSLKNESLMFLLGLARAYISNSKIICVNGLSEDFSEDELLNFMLMQIKKSRSVVLLVKRENIKIQCDLTYEIKETEKQKI